MHRRVWIVYQAANGPVKAVENVSRGSQKLRPLAVDEAIQLAKGGGRVWVEHSLLGTRIYESRAEHKVRLRADNEGKSADVVARCAEWDAKIDEVEASLTAAPPMHPITASWVISYMQMAPIQLGRYHKQILVRIESLCTILNHAYKRTVTVEERRRIADARPKISRAESKRTNALDGKGIHTSSTRTQRQNGNTSPGGIQSDRGAMYSPAHKKLLEEYVNGLDSRLGEKSLTFAAAFEEAGVSPYHFAYARRSTVQQNGEEDLAYIDDFKNAVRRNNRAYDRKLVSTGIDEIVAAQPGAMIEMKSVLARLNLPSTYFSQLNRDPEVLEDLKNRIVDHNAAVLISRHAMTVSQEERESFDAALNGTAPFKRANLVMQGMLAILAKKRKFRAQISLREVMDDGDFIASRVFTERLAPFVRYVRDKIEEHNLAVSGH